MDKNLDQNIDIPPVSLTSQLLNELDQLIDQSDVIRDIVDQSEHLHSLERIIGPCHRTRRLRREIEKMKARLESVRSNTDVEPITAVSSG